MLRTSYCLLFVASAACADGGAVRLVGGRSDTVIVNSRKAVPLNLRLVDAKGVVRQAKRAQFRLVRGDELELSNDGHVKCSRPGDAEVAATHGKLSTRVTIHCRPIASLRMPRLLRLTVGGPPTSLDVGARGLDGESIDMIAGTASVGDSHVVALVDGQVHPKARGITTIEVEAGDCAISVPIEVVESNPKADALLPHQYYAESLSVAAGELRNWRLPPGRYEISLFDANGAPQRLRLASHEMDCAALPRTEQQFSCIARGRASVIVHHTEPAGRGREAKATLLVHRQEGLSSESRSLRPRLYVYPCPFNTR